MKILAADTSGTACGVALVDGDRVLGEYVIRNRNTHSANLCAMVDEVLFRSDLTLADVDALAVVTGPGSFTGVRIGTAVIKGLAHGAGKPCIAVNALEAIARSAGPFGGTICPMQDARAGQVYAAAFAEGKRVLPDEAIRLEDFLNRIGEREGNFLFNGDGAAAHEDRIREIFGERAFFLPAGMNELRPSAAAMIAMEKGGQTGYLDLKETYLRPPNAEKNKKLLEAMSHG